MGEFFAITLLITFAAISPGPDFAMVVKNSLAYSRRAGICTALGIACSMLVHASYCIMGLAIIVAKSPFLFNTIKYIGAAYLAYIGLKALFSRSTSNIIEKPIYHKTEHCFKAFRQGLLCNLLNPKAIMFFLALFTMIVKPTTSIAVQISYAIEIALIHLIWFSCLSIFLTHHKISLLLKKIQPIVTKVMGGFLVAFGLRIAALH